MVVVEIKDSLQLGVGYSWGVVFVRSFPFLFASMEQAAVTEDPIMLLSIDTPDSPVRVHISMDVTGSSSCIEIALSAHWMLGAKDGFLGDMLPAAAIVFPEPRWAQIDNQGCTVSHKQSIAVAILGRCLIYIETR